MQAEQRFPNHSKGIAEDIEKSAIPSSSRLQGRPFFE